jgi:hypothetical protein
MLLTLIALPSISLGSNEASDTPWIARKDFVTVVFKDRLWVMGGANYDIGVGPRPKIRYFNDVWCTSNSLDWTNITKSAPWAAREGLSAVAFKNKIWIMGGTNARGDEGQMNDVWSTSDGKNWECITQHAPWPPLRRAECTVFKDRLFLFKYSEELAHPDECTWFSDDGKTWHKTPTPAWHAYDKVSTAILKGELYLMVPFYDDKVNPYNSIWRSTDGIHWQQVIKNTPFMCVGATLTAYRDRLFVLGGMLGGDSLGDSWVSQDGVTWLQNNPKCDWKPRCWHGAAVLHDYFWILGGWGDVDCLNDVYGSTDGQRWLLPQDIR